MKSIPLACSMVAALWLTVETVAADSFIVAPADCVIMTDGGADELTKQAANELQKHLKLVAGTEVPIENADAVEGKFVFAVGTPPDGAPPLAPEEARWVVTRQRAHLYGDPHPRRGTLFAVYGFLEDQLGIRWIRPGDDRIGYQKQPALTLAVGEHSWSPQLDLRKIRTYARPGRGYPVLKDYVEEYAAFLPSHEEHDEEARDVEQWQWRMRMGGHSQVQYGHAFTDWWDKYSTTHPDYFALNRWGRREPELRVKPGTDTPEWTLKDKQSIKLCVSNPNVARQIVQNWLDQGKRAKWINACMNDQVWGFCRCANCLRLDGRKEGEEPGTYLTGLTDRYVYLANQVARLAREHDPEAGAVMYAYETTEQPPRRQRLESNVVVAIVPTTLDIPALERLFDGWKQAGATKLLMRPNLPLYYNALALPVGCEKQMCDAFLVAHEFGVVGVDYDSLTGMWPYCGITDYILSKTFSDPTKPFEYWEDHYCAAYGPAAGDIKAYHRYWRKELWDKRLLPDLAKIVERGKSHNFARGLMWSLGDYYRAADFDATDAILERAAARNLGARQRELVEELIVANRQARLLAKAVTTRGTEKFEHAQRLLGFREENRQRGAFRWFTAFANESRFGDTAGTKIAFHLRKYPLPWIETALAWQFQLDPNDVGLKEKWQEKPWEDFRNWDRLRTDFFWDNPYDSETDPSLMAKLKDYDGIGWYATRQSIPPEMKGRTVLLYFGAVDESCWVYVNGKQAGAHLSTESDDWRTPFEIRIDPFLDWEQPQQLITVRVDDKAGSGGIWKRVWVVSTKEQP